MEGAETENWKLNNTIVYNKNETDATGVTIAESVTSNFTATPTDQGYGSVLIVLNLTH